MSIQLVEYRKDSEREMSGTETQWERLAEWIHCICIVDFDIGVGQVLEVIEKQFNYVSKVVLITLLF